MAPQKIAQRKRAMRVADAVNKMEGVPVRCYAIELSNAWCEGKITGAQMKEILFEKSHGDGSSGEVKLYKTEIASNLYHEMEVIPFYGFLIGAALAGRIE